MTRCALCEQHDRQPSVQLKYMVVMMCKGVTLTGVVDAGSEECLEAWALHVLRHEPKS